MTANLPPMPRLDLSRDNLYGYTAAQTRAYGEACAVAERERCAKLVETHPTNGDHVGCWFELLAAAIRGGE